MAKILIIEDDHSYLKTLRDRLTSEGYEVISAADGDEGLKKAFEEHPDTLIVDINLPKMNGMVLINKLRHDDWGETVPVILLTNLTATDDIVNGVLEGKPSYYLLKSETTLSDLVSKIQEIITPTSS